MIGKTFGRLTVIARDTSKPMGHGHDSYWICSCICGNTTSVRRTDLTSGKIISCGCYRKELLS